VPDREHHVCPVERAGGLDNRIRRWLQDPRRLLGPFIEEGMTVLDLGCGPGFFTLDLAQMVGTSGHVIAADLQDGMLQIIGSKIHGTELADRVALHKCEENGIGLSEDVDFILAFYVVHEIPGQQKLFAELETILKPNGDLLVVEPPFHVSKKAFEETVGIASAAGLADVGRPRVFPNKAVLLRKAPGNQI
jgi:ubiquinone/menaquinone biosynthesis C-methylase UbiE